MTMLYLYILKFRVFLFGSLYQAHNGIRKIFTNAAKPESILFGLWYSSIEDLTMFVTGKSYTELEAEEMDGYRNIYWD